MPTHYCQIRLGISALWQEYLSCRFIRNAIAAVASYSYGFHFHIHFHILASRFSRSVSLSFSLSRRGVLRAQQTTRRGMWHVAWRGLLTKCISRDIYSCDVCLPLICPSCAFTLQASQVTDALSISLYLTLSLSIYISLYLSSLSPSVCFIIISDDNKQQNARKIFPGKMSKLFARITKLFAV